MSDDDPVIRRLEELGASEAGSLTNERLASIEARVVGAVGAESPTPVATSPIRRAAPMVLAVAALLLLFVVAAAWFGGGSTLTVQAADGVVTIELPDGRSVDASVGLEVPDGSFVDVAPGASIRLGGGDLGPGTYLVRDGTAVLDSVIVDSSTTTSTTSATRTGVGDGDRDDGEGDPVVDVVPTSTPVRPSTTVPPDRPPPRTTLADGSPATTVAVRPTTTVVRRTTTTIVRDTTVPATTTTIVRDTTVPATTTTVPVVDRPDRTTTTTSTSVPVDGSRDGIGG